MPKYEREVASRSQGANARPHKRQKDMRCIADHPHADNRRGHKPTGLDAVAPKKDIETAPGKSRHSEKGKRRAWTKKTSIPASVAVEAPIISALFPVAAPARAPVDINDDKVTDALASMEMGVCGLDVSIDVDVGAVKDRVCYFGSSAFRLPQGFVWRS